MIPAFFDSVLDLIVKTSTELPPDVRAAMATRHGQRAGGHPVGAGAEDHRDQHRPGCQQRGRDLPGHRHADLRDQDAGGRQPDLDQEAGASGRGRSHQARQAAAQLGRFDHRHQLGRQPGPGHADPPLRAMGERRRDRGEADPEGRGLREHQRAVLAAHRTAAPGSRRSQPRRRAQVHPARGVAGAGQGVRAGRRRRGHRRRSHVGLHRGQTAVVPDARRRERRPAAGRARSRRDAHRQHAGRRHHGLWRRRLAHRLQGRRAQPPAGQLLRVGGLRLLGLPATGHRAGRADRRHQALALSRSRVTGHPDDRPGRLSAHGQGSAADHTARRGGGAVAQGRRRRADQRADVHRPRRRPSPHHLARAAGGPARRRRSITAGRS